MATVKAIHWTYDVLKGTELYPVRIRVSVNNFPPAYETVVFDVEGHKPAKAYLKKSHFSNGQALNYSVFHAPINAAIRKRVAECEDVISEWELTGRLFRPGDVLAQNYRLFVQEREERKRNEVLKKQIGESTLFMVRARLLAADRLKRDEQQGRNFGSQVAAWEGFLTSIGRTDVELMEMDNAFIERFFSYCRNKEKRPNKDSTLAIKLQFVRQILNAAVGRVILYSPLRVVRGLKIKSGLRDNLSIEEINKLESIDFNKHRTNARHKLQECVDVFVLQFYLRGSRVGDVLRIEGEQLKRGADGRVLRWAFRQTKRDKPMDMSVPEQARLILEKYDKGDAPGYWLPILKWSYDRNLTKEKNDSTLRYAINAHNNMLNSNLALAMKIAGIDKHITTHCARHAFARHARKKKKKDLMFIRDLMGHSSIKMTEIYTGEHDTQELDEGVEGMFD